MRDGRFALLAAMTALAASDVVAWRSGLAFDATSLDWFWQFLDPELLRHDLPRSVWYRHGQPPLFDLFVGMVLQLPPPAVRPAFVLIYQGLALGVLWGVAWLLRRLATPRWAVVAATVVLAHTPAFVIAARWLFYPLPVAFLLVASTVALARFVDTGRAAWAHGAAAAMAALMLTRAIFHPAWLVLVTAAMAPRLDVGRRRALARALVAPLLLVTLWCAKNWTQVGVFGTSSWLGMHLRNGVHLSSDEVRSLVASGSIPPVWGAPPFLGARAYRAYGFFAAPPPAGGHPAIDAPVKSNGQRNLNHREYARVARAMLAGVGPVLRAHPDRYLARVRRALWLFLQPGPLILFAHADVSAAIAFRDGANRLLFGAAPVGLRGTDGGSWNLLVLAVPAALAAGAWLATRGARGDAVRATIGTYLTLTLVWFATVVNLVEAGENDRMRIEVDPAVVVLVVAGLAAVVRGIGGRDAGAPTRDAPRGPIGIGRRRERTAPPRGPAIRPSSPTARSARGGPRPPTPRRRAHRVDTSTTVWR